MSIESKLQQYRPEIRVLLKKNNCYFGRVDMAAIQRAHKKHGESFMLKLLEIITPDDSSFTNLAGIATIGAVQAQQNLTAAQQLEAATDEKKGGKFWGFWENLFNTVDKAGQTVADFKADVYSDPNKQFYDGAPVNIQQQQLLQQKKTQNLIFAAGGALLLLVIVLLIIKK